MGIHYLRCASTSTVGRFVHDGKFSKLYWMDEYLLFKAKNVIHKKKFDMKALFGDALLISNIHNGQSTAILCNIPGKLVSKWQLDGSANLPY